MAGLTTEGFTADSYSTVSTRIKARLEVLSPGIDTTSDSVDGHFVDIMSFEFSSLWSSLLAVYKSGDPINATGAGLRSLGMFTGLAYGAATKGEAYVNLIGTAGVVVPQNSVVTDAAGNEFYTEISGTIPASVKVISKVSGILALPAGTITTIKSAVNGWTSVTQTIDGTSGAVAETEEAFRNRRNRMVQKNFVSAPSLVQTRLLELGLEQATVVNNSGSTTLSDGTPAKHIHVVVGEVGTITDENIARTIMVTMGLGTQTYGSTSVTINDSQGIPQTIKFSKATAVPIYVTVDLTYLSAETAGVTETIQAAIATDINAYLTGEDVYWSRLLEHITPYGKAKVSSIKVGRTASPATPYVDEPIGENEYASILLANIIINEV